MKPEMNRIFTLVAGFKMDSRQMEIIHDLFFRFLLNTLSILLKIEDKVGAVILEYQLYQLCRVLARRVPPWVQQPVITTACTAVESAVQNGPQQLHHYVAEASFMKTHLGRGPIYPNAFFPFRAAIKE